ncbi:MAG: ATP-binding protein [Phycisphaerae bacterium]|jgi:hypothetical protein
MVRGIIKVDVRHTMRNIRQAMQGNVIRALVELITNSDDSYIRQESKGRTENGSIEIIYKKDGYRGIFAVRDHAEGMSIDDVENNLTGYGSATSGMQTGKKVRGYFGQGAKDALVSMINGKILTFKDNKFAECKLFEEADKPWYDISGPIPATQKLRDTYGISGNGTIAVFEAERKVPQFDTIHTELANNSLLRKIMVNPNRKILLIDEPSGKTRRLQYQMPEGREILADEFVIEYENYEPFTISLSIWRAEKELTQRGDDRDGGLLLLDGEDMVLGISLFKYDNEPLAARFFGEVRTNGFRELLKKEEPVLKQDRSGIEPHHPFCEKLIAEIEKRLEKRVEEEKLRKQREEQTKIDPEERRRYKNAFSILNEIAEIEAQAAENLGQELTGKIEEPPNGFHLYPSSAQITVGKRYIFELRLNTMTIRHGTIIKIKCTNSKIHILTPEIKVALEDDYGILRKYITVEGTEPNIEGTLQATAADKLSQSKILVIPEKETLLEEGMGFQPESLTLRPNKPRKVCLLVYVKIIEGGSEIKIFSDNNAVHISQDKIVVNEADAIRHFAKYDLEVWGDGVGQNALITAECESHIALLEARIKSQEDTTDKKHGKGMFDEPEQNYEPDPLQRTSYSAETGKVIIYVNFPSVKHYLGDKCQYLKTLPAQVFVADLLAERCFFEIAKKKMESSGVAVRPEAVSDRIQRDAQELSLKYGKKVHEALVDQKLVSEAKGINQT